MSKSSSSEVDFSSGVANVAVVVGVLSSAPRVRELPSGASLASLEVTTSSTPCETVPVAMFDPPANVTGLTAGDSVLVLGRIRRRFFRARTVTQSRTELVADRVARTRTRRSVDATFATAADRLASLGEGLGRPG